MNVQYLPKEDESEYVCVNSPIDNVYVCMTARCKRDNDQRPVSYLEIVSAKDENIYEYIEYSEMERKKVSHYNLLIKRSLWIVLILFTIVSVFAFFMYIWKLNHRPLAINEKLDRNATKMLFALNITTPADRQSFVRNMTREAWYAYEKYAWGSGALKPLTKEIDDSTTLGQTIVATMTTLWLMELYEEFDRGKQWIINELHHLKDTDEDVPVYDIVVNYVGSLLSCFALTGDELFINKSYEITDMLVPAFNFTCSTGIIHPDINLKTGNLSGTSNYLSFLGHRQIEMQYFIQLTGEHFFVGYQNSISAIVENLKTHNGLYFEKYYFQKDWHSSTSTLNQHGKEFYYNLIRSYIQSDGVDWYSYVQYARAIAAIDAAGMFGKSNQTGLVFAREIDISEGLLRKWSSGSSCYLGAMLALGVDAIKRNWEKMNATIEEKDRELLKPEKIERQWQLALALTETCHQAAVRTRTGLLPQRFIFTQHEEATTSLVTIGLLGPELAESYFILWRLTHDVKYREYAWQLVTAIYKHCRTENGYARVQNVNRVPTIKNNVQLPIFLSGTLNHLYLIFSDDSVLPLDKWVFSAVGQPLPIYGNISDSG